MFSILNKTVKDKSDFKLSDLLEIEDQKIYVAARQAFVGELEDGEQEVCERTEPTEVLNEALDCLRNIDDVRYWNYFYKKLTQMQEEANIKGLRYSLTEKTVQR
jgi:hypothetical protein